MNFLILTNLPSLPLLLRSIIQCDLRWEYTDLRPSVVRTYVHHTNQKIIYIVQPSVSSMVVLVKNHHKKGTSNSVPILLVVQVPVPTKKQSTVEVSDIAFVSWIVY